MTTQLPEQLLQARVADIRELTCFAELTDSQIATLLTHIAMHDLNTYTRAKRVETKYRDAHGGNLPLSARRRLSIVLRSAADSLFREPTPAEAIYAQLRVRHRVRHMEAVRASGLTGVTAEDALRVRRTVQAEFDKATAQLAADTGVTRDDVVQGLLNAVACARHSADLVLAWSELGKLLGYYEETKIRIEQRVEGEVKHTHKIEGTVDIRALSDADLMQFAGSHLINALQPQERAALEHTSTPARFVPEIADAEFTPVDARAADDRRAERSAVPGDGRPVGDAGDRDEVRRGVGADDAGGDPAEVPDSDWAE